MPNNKLYFSYVLQTFHKNVYISNVIIFFLSKLKNIPKGVRSTKCPSFLQASLLSEIVNGFIEHADSASGPTKQMVRKTYV
jgi:hypothetical protein